MPCRVVVAGGICHNFFGRTDRPNLLCQRWRGLTWLTTPVLKSWLIYLEETREIFTHNDPSHSHSTPLRLKLAMIWCQNAKCQKRRTNRAAKRKRKECPAAEVSALIVLWVCSEPQTGTALSVAFCCIAWWSSWSRWSGWCRSVMYCSLFKKSRVSVSQIVKNRFRVIKAKA